MVKLRVAFLLLSCAIYCGAQAAMGSLRGTVSDSTGALLPNCSVNIANAMTDFARTVKTNERGDFNAPSVPVGVYNVTVELAGFQKTVLSGVELQVDQTATLPIELKPGAINGRVEVQAVAISPPSTATPPDMS